MNPSPPCLKEVIPVVVIGILVEAEKDVKPVKTIFEFQRFEEQGSHRKLPLTAEAVLFSQKSGSNRLKTDLRSMHPGRLR